MKRRFGRIYKQKSCNMYYIQYRKNGKRIRESTGTNKYNVAEQRLKQRLAQITTGTYVGPQVERVKVAELAEPFFRDQRINERKGRVHTEKRWKNHLEPFFGLYRAAEVGTDALDQYVDGRMKEGVKNATINREIAVLRRMFRLGYYAKPQKVASLPKFPRLEERNVRVGFVEPEKYKALVAAASELWLRAIFEIYHTYGWRKREVLGMRVRHADFGANVIRLDVGSTKNNEGREVHMTASVRTLLTECAQGKKPDDFLFTRSNGKRVGDFRKAWRNLCIAAGVGQMICNDCNKVVTGKKCECGSRRLHYQGLIVHDMRRTAARNLRRAGVAEGVIMRVGGWKTRSIFERYNIVSQTDIRDALQKLEQSRADSGHNFGHNASESDPEGASSTVARVN